MLTCLVLQVVDPPEAVLQELGVHHVELNEEKLPGSHHQGGPHHLELLYQPGQETLHHANVEESEGGIEIKDCHPLGLLLHQLPDDMREEEDYPQVLLPPPLLLEEVLPPSLGLHSLAEVSSHGFTGAGGKRVDSEVLQLTGHGTVKEARHLGTLSQDAAGGLCGGKKLDHPLPVLLQVHSLKPHPS